MFRSDPFIRALLVCLLVIGCGQGRESQLTVIGGGSKQDYRGVVPLTDPYGEVICSGIVVSETTVITAAHCPRLFSHRYDVDAILHHLLQGVPREEVIVGGQNDCQIMVNGQRALACYSPQAYFDGRQTKTALRQIPGERMPSPPDLERLLDQATVPYDLSLLVFPAGGHGVDPADFLKISDVLAEPGQGVTLTGYGAHQAADAGDHGQYHQGPQTIDRIDPIGIVHLTEGRSTSNQTQKPVALAKGDSGGALISSRKIDQGKVLGLNSRIDKKPTGIHGQVMSLQSDFSQRFFNQVKRLCNAHGLPCPEWESSSQKLAAHWLGADFAQKEKGLWVAFCPAASLAAKIGLRPKDELLSINGRSIHLPRDLALAEHKSEGQSPLTLIKVRRGQQRIEFKFIHRP